MKTMMLELAGMLGGVLLMVAFRMSSRGSKRSKLIGALNIGGALCLLVSAAMSRAWAIVGLQATWTAIAIDGLIPRCPKKPSLADELARALARQRDENGKPLSRLALLDQFFETAAVLEARGVDVKALMAA